MKKANNFRDKVNLRNPRFIVKPLNMFKSPQLLLFFICYFQACQSEDNHQLYCRSCSDLYLAENFLPGKDFLYHDPGQHLCSEGGVFTVCDGGTCMLSEGEGGSKHFENPPFS